MNQKLLKTLALLLTLTGLAGCEEKIDYKKEEKLQFDADQDLQKATQQNRLPLLATKLGCKACHAIDHRVVGPAWQEVGKRYRNATSFEYKGTTYPLTEGLINKISHGGSGNWGVEAMPAVDPTGSRHDQLEKLVKFILQLGKQ